MRLESHLGAIEIPEVVQRVSDEMMSPHSIALDKVRDRLGEILDSHPEFLERLAYLIEPISNLDTDSIDEAGKMTRDDLVSYVSVMGWVRLGAICCFKI